MSIRKEQLLKPLLDFEEKLGFKLSQLTGHRAHKWVISLNGDIDYAGVATIQENLQSALFRPQVEPESERIIISLIVEEEDASYFNSEQMQGHPDSVSVLGLWEKNSNDPDEQHRYYYFEPISPSEIR